MAPLDITVADDDDATYSPSEEPTRVEMHRETGGDWEAESNTLSDLDLAGSNTT